MFSIFGLLGNGPASSARVASARRRPSHPSGRRFFRPCVEGFEDRVVPAAPVLNAAQVAQAIAITPDITITGVQLTNLQIVDDVLQAAGTVTGTLAGLPFTADITNFALQLVPNIGTPGQECAILDLELGPIDIDLLGLHVDTSPICLEITATHGGGLLGDLLCGLADGLPLGLLPNLGALSGAVENILGQILAQGLGNAGPAQAGGDICDGECEILDLALGPVDLSLLGLNVSLDDCEGGPVLVCVSASEGQGLLGDLLCGLTGNGVLLDLGDLQGIIGAVTDDLDLTEKQLDKLVKQVTNILRDGDLSANEIARLIRRLDRLAA